MLNSEGRESLGSQRSDFVPHGGDYEPPRDKHLPRRPHRKNRKRLHIEEAMDARLILPKVVPPTLTRYSMGGGKIVDMDDFQTYPGVNDNNSIEDVGLASRLAWCTILSRDEKEIFRSLPEGEDNSDYLVVKAVQQVVAVNAQHRTY